jgi:MFS family permease
MKNLLRPREGVWRNRDFRLLLGGQLVSQLGNQLQGLALPLVVLAITGSAADAGLLLGVSTATYLLVGLVAGALVDRWNRKRTMIGCELGRAVLTATVPVAVLCGALTMAQLYVVAIGTGVLTVLFQTANSTALPNIVRREDLPAALGATHAAGSALGIVGSAIAGAAYALGRAVPFAVNAISFLVSAVTLRRIRAEFQEDERAASPSVRELLADIRHGLAWVWGQPVLRLLTVVEAADGLRYGAGYLIIIELARGVGADPLQVGLVFCGVGLGGLVGGLAAGRVVGRFRLGRVAIGMLWVEAIAFPLYAVAPAWGWLAGVAFLESVITPIYSVAMDTYRVSITPDRMRGRVSSAVGTLVTGAMSVGTILGGLLLASIGAPALALGCGAWLLALAALTTSSRTIRRAAGAPVESAAEESGVSAAVAPEGAA